MNRPPAAPTRPLAALAMPLAALALPPMGAASGVPSGPQPVVLIPDGTFKASDGRPQGLQGWRLDAPIAQRLIRRVQGRQTKLVVNYEHAEPVGAPLPAAGWIDPATLAYQPGTGLTAQVDWLPKAHDMLASGEYAYLSPVIRYDGKTGEVLDLLLAGLTNTPALDVLPALSARLGLCLTDDDPPPPSSSPDPETPMIDLAKLRQALSLAADADDTAILARADALSAQVAALTSQVSDQTAKLSALETAKTPDPTQYVPKAVYDEALAQLTATSQANETAELSRLIEDGLSSGRITGPAHADWLKGQGIAALRAYLAEAPAVAALTRTQTQGQDRGQPTDPALSAEEAAVLSQMGLDRAAYLQTRATLFPAA